MKAPALHRMFLTLLLACAFSAQAQRGPVATGGNATGAGGTSSYSLGQIDYLSLSGANPTICEGLQQPFEIYIIASSANPAAPMIATVFPNPASGSVTLDLGTKDTKHLRYAIFDIQGKLLMKESLRETQTSISLAGLAQATYFLSVFRGDTVLQSFKIIKCN